MGTARKAAAGPMPAELMAGPCIEDWFRKGIDQSLWPEFSARRNWSAAVDRWAVESGWASESRPASNARNLARTRHPWSRMFLIEHGRGHLVDFYEGRRATFPDAEEDGWRPREGPPPVASTRH